MNRPPQNGGPGSSQPYHYEDESFVQIRISELEQELASSRDRQTEQESRILTLQNQIDSSKSRQTHQDSRLGALEDTIAESAESQRRQAAVVVDLQSQLADMKRQYGRNYSALAARGMINPADTGASLVADPEALNDLKRATTTGFSFEEWHWKIHSKLQEMKDCDERTKIDYVASRTTGSAFLLIRDHLPRPKLSIIPEPVINPESESEFPPTRLSNTRDRSRDSPPVSRPARENGEFQPLRSPFPSRTRNSRDGFLDFNDYTRRARLESMKTRPSPTKIEYDSTKKIVESAEELLGILV